MISTFTVVAAMFGIAGFDGWLYDSGRAGGQATNYTFDPIVCESPYSSEIFLNPGDTIYFKRLEDVSCKFLIPRIRPTLLNQAEGRGK